ncbi:alpha/beta hydrolase [Flavitalea sp. BT771]|uniref:alpha/beta hydrolase n=1 Tax=Flavitalea sp. BT771 TaxID=3063329 RepID=UPI0026E4095A|nr:alpha/beta hydrolase [Flavitalea sp. BT771]MDO6428951.1 alpha/beta hydrolase [Flavitalea sp. BT771]MDV6218921.1 alpha/beta hydrolase [Flavitalea sp. BT771]
MTKKKIFRWAKVLILLYSIIGIAAYYLQDKLLFHPEPVDRKTNYHFTQPYSEVNLAYDKETNLNIIQFKPEGADTPKGVVLYFHGNQQNVTHYAPYAADFTAKGYEVWMPDYPGFGKSTGKLTEKALYAHALIVYKLARSRWPPSQIILYGKSLGTGIAAQLASIRDCRRLILECPYYSMTSMARRYLFLYPVGSMLHYRFPTYEYLPAVTAPITIFHGTNDGVVAYSNAARLKALLKPGDEFIAIDGGGHNDLHDFSAFRQKVMKEESAFPKK